jgi:two-component system response regulator MtrA
VVLVVDDDLDIAESIGDVLRSSGYQPVLAADGAGALDAANRHQVMMVLLDWRLPEEPAGANLVRRLRDLAGHQVPIVVLSADPLSLAEARLAQVSDYLPKPFEIADLLHLVDVYCPA